MSPLTAATVAALAVLLALPVAARVAVAVIEALARAHRMHTLNAYLEAMGRPASSI